MDWQDTGFVLAVRRHGESGLIVELLTAERGRHAGLVRGGQSPRRRALFQPGNLLSAHWRGRLPEHLGQLDCELLRANAALPEHEPHRDIYDAFAVLIGSLDSAEWAQHYVAWERDLLAALGFGLDL